MVFWTRTLGDATLELCEWGYCFKTNIPYSSPGGTSLGMGWGYIVVPIILGIIIGIIMSYLIRKGFGGKK